MKIKKYIQTLFGMGVIVFGITGCGGAQGEGAYPFVANPSWVVPAYEDLNAERLELEANEDQFDYVLEPGSYWMRAGTSFPAAHWRCGFLVVTEA